MRENKFCYSFPGSFPFLTFFFGIFKVDFLYRSRAENSPFRLTLLKSNMVLSDKLGVSLNLLDNIHTGCWCDTEDASRCGKRRFTHTLVPLPAPYWACICQPHISSRCRDLRMYGAHMCVTMPTQSRSTHIPSDRKVFPSGMNCLVQKIQI